MTKSRESIVFPFCIFCLSMLALAGWFFTIASSLPGREAVVPVQSKPLLPVETSDWMQSNLSWETSPVDLSFLNSNERPAGKRGFVTAEGDALKFGDGSAARFWGANLTAHALFATSHKNVRRQAQRISALGFNLVRIHHHDSPWVSPNIFGRDATDTQILDPVALAKLDWWIKCLKDQGIYVWLDLHVQRALKEGDHIHGFDEIRKSGKAADLKGYNYVNASIRLAMQRFNEAYLTHINAYTGVAYKDEPAIMALLITNENDVTHHFGNLLLPDSKVPLHNKLYMDLAKEFSTRNNLPADRTWRAWENGAAKLFLNDLEYSFNMDMISELRGLGVKIPVATTSTWGDNEISSLPALTAGDIIDAHAYGAALELDKNPLTDSSMVHRLSMAQLANKPMSVSEWNVSPFPVPDRHSSPLYIAAAACQQGWDAVMLYAYAQVPLDDGGTPSNWSAFNDPALISTLPAAALLYRLGHVREADTTYVLSPDRKQLFYQANSADNSVAARTAVEKGKLVIALPKTAELPWLKSEAIPAGAKVIQNLQLPMIADDATGVLSDTGQIRRNWRLGIYTINTARTQAALGKIGKEKLTLADVTFDIKTANASVVVQSLDGAPIGLSSSLMISLGAQAIPNGNTLPFRVEPVLGKLTIRARKGLRFSKNTLYPKKNFVTYADGKYVIDLDAALGTSMLLLK